MKSKDMRLGMPVAIYGTICQLRELNGVSIRTDNGNTLDVPCGCLHKLVAEPEETGEKKPVYDLPFHEAVRLMMEGKKVERGDGLLHQFDNERTMTFDKDRGMWVHAIFDGDDFRFKWRVVSDDEQ